MIKTAEAAIFQDSGPAIELELRPPEVVMTPERLGSLKPTRLSFGWAFMARMISERWRITRKEWNFDSEGQGYCVYLIDARGYKMSFIMDFQIRSLEEKGGANYGHLFDGGGALIEGAVTDEFISKFRSTIHRKPFEGEAGYETLAWVRINRSTRTFDKTVEDLSEGRQPDVSLLCRVGYIMRSAQFHANGMCGIRLFSEYPEGHPFRYPYAPQVFCAYMTREFSCDIADHLALQRGGGKAVRLHPNLRRYLGIGNGTGIGLIVFTRNHPRLMNRWIYLREKALALALARPADRNSDSVARFIKLLSRYIEVRQTDQIEYGETYLTGPQLAEQLRPLLSMVECYRACGRFMGAEPESLWKSIKRYAEENVDEEAAEAVNAVIIDAHPDIPDGLMPETILEGYDELNPEISDVDFSMTIDELRSMLTQGFDWIFRSDALSYEGRYWTWFLSANGEYPGVLAPEDLEDDNFLSPIGDIPTQAQQLRKDLDTAGLDETLASFLLVHPEHRWIVRWIQTAYGLPYCAVRTNFRARTFYPTWISRFVLESIKGFQCFEPNKEYAGGTVVFLQGAPLPTELAAGTDDIWANPPIPRLDEEVP